MRWIILIAILAVVASALGWWYVRDTNDATQIIIDKEEVITDTKEVITDTEEAIERGSEWIDETVAPGEDASPDNTLSEQSAAGNDPVSNEDSTEPQLQGAKP